MAQYDKLINLGLLSQFLTKAKTVFAPKITASGILKGDGQGGVSAATAGTDYATPAQVNAKYTKPSGGIPDTDIVSAATWNAKATKPTKNSITLSATWSGDDPYTQVVTVSGYTLTANSKVDLQPDATTVNQLIADGVIALYIENNNGTLTAYAIGAAPTASLSVQCTISEVAV